MPRRRGLSAPFQLERFTQQPPTVVRPTLEGLASREDIRDGVLGEGKNHHLLLIFPIGVPQVSFPLSTMSLGTG